MGTQALDDAELEDELAELQQEELDSKMLNTGTVPVSDQVQRLPNVAVGERESLFPVIVLEADADCFGLAKGKAPVRAEEEDEEEELRKLQAEMAM